MTQKTAQQRAEERIPFGIATTESVGLSCDAVHNTRDIARAGYATCIREQVEPLEAEVVRLRALAQELVDRHGDVKWDAENCDWTCERCGNDYGMKQTDLFDSITQALAAAKEHSFVPTNTTEG